MDDVTLRLNILSSDDDCEVALLDMVMQHGDMFSETDKIVGAMYDNKCGLLTLMFDDRDQLYRVPRWFRNCIHDKAVRDLLAQPAMITLMYMRTEIPNKITNKIQYEDI